MTLNKIAYSAASAASTASTVSTGSVASQQNAGAVVQKKAPPEPYGFDDDFSDSLSAAAAAAVAAVSIDATTRDGNPKNWLKKEEKEKRMAR